MKKFTRLLTLLFSIFCFLSTISCSFANNVYTVENKYFEKATFTKHRLTSVGVNGHSGSGTSYYVYISSKCSVALTEYTITAELYNENDILLDCFEETILKDVFKEKEFTVSFEVSKSIYDSLNYVVVEYVGQSTSNPEK